MIQRGSEFKKWDLHIHSPFTAVNNQFEKLSGGEPNVDKFIENIKSFDLEQIKNIRNIYQSEPQCTNRRNHSSEDSKVKEYIDKLENPDLLDGTETVPDAELNEDFPS